MTDLGFLLLPIVVAAVLVLFLRGRSPGLPEGTDGLDRAASSEVRRSVRAGTPVTRPELADAAASHALYVLAANEHAVRRMRSMRWMFGLVGAGLIVAGVLSYLDDPTLRNALTPLVGVLGCAMPFVNPMINRRRIARAEAALAADRALGAPSHQAVS
ncbi:hypothetical protein [Cryptosporangium arvum]|uniref:hypothetical protein n=1 Tax=Cryptosporangium arvum TaxID=80871 RepID=UPI0004B51AF9|nr:hypothetical protein [Cryptosporangium arvum]